MEKGGFCFRFGHLLIIAACRIHLKDEGAGCLEFGFGIAGSQEAIVSDFNEARGQYMEEEAADKLLGGQSDLSGF